MRIKTVIIILLLMPVINAKADMFDIKNIPEKEKFSLKFNYKGIDLARPNPKPFNQRYMAAQSKLRVVYETYFVGEGPEKHLETIITGTSQNGYTEKQYFKFKPDAKLVLSYYERTIFNTSGKKICVESYDLSTYTPPWPKDMTHPSTLPLALRGFDFVPNKERSFYLWFNPATVFSMRVALKSEEEVVVAAGTFQCYRMEMDPDLVDFGGPLLGRVLKPVVAKYLLWLDKKPPYRIVKYQGPFGQINIASGPTETYELAKIGD